MFGTSVFVYILTVACVVEVSAWISNLGYLGVSLEDYLMYKLIW